MGRGGRALSCRRFEEIDLPAFLQDPRGAAFRAFREHYPNCRECAAEMRVYTELLLGVEGGAATPVHPDPAELECFDREPASLPRERSDFVAAHLRSCATCADELSALRGHDPEWIRDVPPSAAASRWRRLFWNPAFGLVLVGLVALPLLYRSVGSQSRGVIEGTAKQSAPSRPTARAKRSPEAASKLQPESAQEFRDDTTLQDRAQIVGVEEGSPAEPARTPDGLAGRMAQADPRRAEGPSDNASKLTERDRAPAVTPPTVLHAPAAPPAVLPAPAPLAAEMEAPVADADLSAAGARQAKGTKKEDGKEHTGSEAMASAPVFERKNEDPLAHHRFIPTLRLRPGQTSWGPASELGAGFFLEIPLPRESAAGVAQVLIIPEGLREQQARRRESLSAEARALDSLAGKDLQQDALPREFVEELPVEAKQRSLMLQIPPDVFEVGRYRIDLELRSDGEIRGRGRFRLELLDE